MPPYHFGVELNESLANAHETCRPVVVGPYPPNALRLHDMHGNVREWCSDWYTEFHCGQREPNEPTGPSRSWNRVVRGGSCYSLPEFCRSASRGKFEAGGRYGVVGFRVIMTVAETQGTGKALKPEPEGTNKTDTEN